MLPKCIIFPSLSIIGSAKSSRSLIFGPVSSGSGFEELIGFADSKFLP